MRRLSKKQLRQARTLALTLFLATLYLLLQYADVKSFDEEVLQNVYSIYNQTFSHYKHNILTPPIGNKSQDNTNETKLICRNQEVFPATEIPVLTLFATMMNKPSKVLINSITVRNWAQFGSIIKPVLFLDATEKYSALASDAKSHGWDVLLVDQTNEFGTPVFKDMFTRVRKKYSSVFHGYSNGDILYDHTLPKTLLAVAKALPKLNSSMLVGIRNNLNMTKYLNYKYGLEQIPPNTTIETVVKKFRDRSPTPLWCQQEVVLVARERTIPFSAAAMDYFLLSNHSFPWDDVKNVVIGRPGYDNYFHIFAKDHKTHAIDASMTINALHQTGEDGNLAGAKDKMYSRYNKKLIGPLNYGRGLTYLCKLYTYFSKDQVQLARRLYRDRRTYDTMESVI